MWWMIGLVLMGWLGPALAQESQGDNEQLEVDNARRASDWAIVRFNTDVEDFPSWVAFATAVLAQVAPGTLGTCYGYSGGTVQVTRAPVPRADKEAVWQKTTGKGWQQIQKDRTFLEGSCWIPGSCIRRWRTLRFLSFSPS